MCGLTGFLSQKWKSDYPDVIQRMTDSIAHRGPDGDGIFVDSNAGIALGHRRLSVVDLSSAGAQPMTSSCGRYVMVYNGELYNNDALRCIVDSNSDGQYSWAGHSDSETLITLVSRFGVERSITLLNGMFAIAIWDRQQYRLHLVRDRFGEKPLYFGRCADALVFGSELRSVTQYPDMSTELDNIAVAQMVRYSAVPAPLSIYKNISKVRPAHHVVFDRRGEEMRNECYWNVAEFAYGDAQLNIDKHGAVEWLSENLPSIVRSRTASDVPLGAFLSGGVDSSLVVALMQESSSKPVNTFTMGFEYESHNEAPIAAKIAKVLGTRHTELYVSGEEAIDVVDELPVLYDEPFGDSSQIPTVLVSRLAKKHVTVCLTGDGGDELFGGYRRYQKADKLWRQVNNIPNVIKNRFNPNQKINLQCLTGSNTLKSMPILGAKVSRLDEVFELIGAREFDEFYDAFLAQRTGTLRLIPSVSHNDSKVRLNTSEEIPRHQRMLYRDMSTYLHDVVLTKVDRASMSCGLETRAPLLDPKLAEFAAGLSWSVKCHEGVGKWPLVNLLKEFVPKELVDRPKMGFGVPIHEWLRGPLNEWAQELLSETSLQQSGMLNVQGIRELWELHNSGKKNVHHALWNILMFQAWLRVHDWS